MNVNVSNVNYGKLMGQLKHNDDVLLLIMVDLLDMPGSIFQDLPKFVGGRKPVIIVGMFDYRNRNFL